MIADHELEDGAVPSSRLGPALDIGERTVIGMTIAAPTDAAAGNKYRVEIGQTNGFRLLDGQSFVIAVE